MKYRKRIWIMITGLLLLTMACSLVPFGRLRSGGEDGAGEEAAAEVEAAPPSRDDRLGEPYESLEGGFSFQQIAGYDLEEFYGIVSMSPRDADQTTGPMITLIGGLNDEAKDAEQLLLDLEGGLPETMELSRSKKIRVDGIQGLTVDFSGTSEGVEVEGQAVLIAVTDTQMFNLAAIYPADGYGREEQSLIEALLDTVRFFEPREIDESSGETSGEEPLEIQQESRTEIRQWAVDAYASSQYSDPAWAAFQAAGPPDSA